MKVLYIYSGTRKDKFSGRPGVDCPDTQFYGMNHLGRFGVEAEFKEPTDYFWIRFLAGIFGFRIRHFWSYFLARGYDVVFGSSLLYTMIWIKILGKCRTKFILLNIGLTRTLAANQDQPLKLKFIKWLVRELDGIVCLSTVQQRYLEKKLSEMAGKIYFVPLGVDTRYYQPAITGRKNYILSVGRDNGRDYKTVVETARLMPQEEFQIVCSRRNLSGLTDIPSNVKIFFDLPFTELHKKYQEAKMLLLITHDDNYLDGADCSGQITLLESMASGLPVIASRKRYLKDYAEDGKEILLVNFYAPDDLAEKISVINNDPAFGLTLARRARERVERQFSTEKMAKNLAKVFKLYAAA